MSAPGRQLLWQRLREAALVEGEAPAPDAGAPWFVRVMLGVAGWIGALFLLGFVGIGLAFIVESAGLSFFVGAMVCGAVALLFRSQTPGDVLGQFGLAVSLAGQGLMALGIFRGVEGSPGTAAFAIAVQQAVLFVMVPHFVHRLWTAWSGAYAFIYMLAELGLAAFAPPLATAALLVVWLRELEHPRQGELVRAGGYGLALAAVQGSIGQHVLGLRPAAGSASWLYEWGAGFACAAVVLCAAWALLRREGVPPGSGPGRAALIGALILALVSLNAPGVATASAILVVGYANGNRVLAGLGLVALLGYLSHYYYSLHATLLEKSALLAAAGVALLLARLALGRLWPPQEERRA
jgi:hypothetical protein